MKKKSKARQPKLVLDMDFGDALQRFIQTKPEEVEDNVDTSKKRKPPRAKKKTRGGPAGKVVALGDVRRNRKS